MSHTAATLQEAFKYLFPDELIALKELAVSLPVYPVVVNIGAGAGTSGLAFLECRPDLYLYTVDITKEDSPFGCLAAEAQVIMAANVDWHFFGSNDVRWRQIHADSKAVAKEWPNPLSFIRERNHRLVDMVFIDGDHSYEGCAGDILQWLGVIRSDGIIAVHDFDKATAYSRENLPTAVPHPKPWPGVDQAVRDHLMGHYEQILHVDTLIAFRV